MNTLNIHPATIRLLNYQAVAQWNKLRRGFRGRRRLALSILGLVLALVWAGQAVGSLLLREPADPAKLRVWIPVSMLAYALWHVLKTACRKPIEPFEWTPAERELLLAAPLSRGELIGHRLLSIGLASLAKAACFSLLMLPDLKVWVAGLIGMFLALLLVDLLRIAVEIYAYGISRQEFLRFRAAVLIISAAGAASALISHLCQAQFQGGHWASSSLGIFFGFLKAVMNLRTTWVGTVAEAPFQLFSLVILSPRLSPSLLGLILCCTLVVVGMLRAVLWLDQFYRCRRLEAERDRCRKLVAESQSTSRSRCSRIVPVRVPLRLAGAGSLAWRQWRGAMHYRSSVLLALLLPAVLTCTTILVPQTSHEMLTQIVGALVFYSFLLLPTALKFDFRRDIDRLGVIKALPIGPAAVTVGQLAVPVLITTLFQLTVLLAAIAIRPFPLASLAMAMIILLPVNVLIFSTENLIFMLYPYRLNQEGVGIFIRSVLTFTAKGILFACGAVAALAWAMVAYQCGSLVVPNNGQRGALIMFTVGLWIMTSALALAATWLLIRVYRQFDPSQDAPAMS